MRYAERCLRTWGSLMASGVMLGAYPLYWLGTQARAHVSLERTAALFLTLDGVAWGLTLPLAALLAMRPTAPRWSRWWPRLVWLAFALNMGVMGATVFASARVAWHVPGAVATLALALLLAGPFLRHPPATQARLASGLLKAGLVATLAPFLTLPWVLGAWAADHPPLQRRPGGLTPRQSPPEVIVLVTFDAFARRASSLASARPAAGVGFAALAASSFSFPGLRAASERTRISLPVLLSGQHPPAVCSHPDTSILEFRQGALRGLAGHLRAAGYTTACSSTWVGPDTFGMRQEFDLHLAHKPYPAFNTTAFNPGWDVLTNPTPRLAAFLEQHNLPRPPDEVQLTRRSFDEALHLLASGAGNRFVWLHLPAPHTPCFRMHVRPGEHPLVAGLDYDPAPQPYPDTVAPGAREGLRETYRGYAAFAEAELTRFVEGLRARGLWERTMLVATSDHGEDYTDDAPILGHANGLTSEWITNVPLVIHLPGQTRPVVKPGPCTHIDLVPTILAQVFERPPAGFPGRVLTGPEPLPDRQVYHWAMGGKHDGGTPHQRVVAYTARWKLVKVVTPQPGLALYDMPADPDARQDVAARHPEVVAAMHARLMRECPP
ncbi:MAG: sulfatase-like hydrolase/transferase [Candidatus Sericytochromatia bacterium]|nr:sulfatase-like hydrolase/transferase [Candidatus Sericytochromatia bacterium]